MSNNKGGVALGGLNAWWVWVLGVTFVVFLFSIQTGYAIVNPSVQGDVTLSVSQVATIAAVYTWVFAIFQFYGGALLDRLGSRFVLPISILLVTIGVFVFANAQDYSTLLLSQFILAVGSCTGFVGAGYLGGKWFGMAKFSFMFGLVQFVAALTSAFSQNLIELSLQHVSWRELFNYVGVFGLGLFVLGAIFIRDPAPVSGGMKNGVVAFFSDVTKSLIDVCRIGHVWMSSLMGAALFGAMLALGVVWGPKLLMVQGFEASSAYLGASMLWLGLAVGSPVFAKWSDKIARRKPPIIIGTVLQLIAFLVLLYAPVLSLELGMAMCFLFGFANASHMLAFSAAADVVKPEQIGTSAAIVNGFMFIFGGILIGRPGVLVGHGIDKGLVAQSLELAHYAARPIMIALVVALILALLMKESYPGSSKQA